MIKKISLKALEDYSDDFASKISTSYFASKRKITGLEIVNFSNITQVNLFIIRELQTSWKLEEKKLQSPFFDFTAPAVKEALARFQIVLSNNISISLENFQPLVKKAVWQTLYLILSPYEYFSRALEISQNKQIKIKSLKTEFKFIVIHKAMFAELIQTLEKNVEKYISGIELLSMVEVILKRNNFFSNDIQSHILPFSKILPLQLSQIYETKMPTPISTSKPAIILQRTNIVQSEKQKELSKYLSKKSGTSTVAENYQRRKQIKEHLTVNQKFMFTKILFSGDFELFSATIENLDQLNSKAEAMRYIENNFPEWSKSSEEYKEFIEIMEKRF